MRVAIVAEGSSLESGVGTERYSWELSEGLRRKGIDVALVSSKPSRKRFALAVNATTKVPILTLRALHHAELVHATDPSSALILPFTSHRTVVTFHDLMPLLIRTGQYGPWDRMFAQLGYRLSAKCDAVIAVTEQTKNEVIRYLGVEEKKVHVINEGVSQRFSVITAPSKREMIVGYVGDINPRKRLDFLLEGFAILRRSHPNAKLKIVGRNVAEYLRAEHSRLLGLVRRLGLEDGVSFTGYVSEERLVELHNEMKALVLPSDYEGFGFPILEAERCGTPVIIRGDARISPEVAGASIRVGSPQELADRIGELFGSPALHAERVQLGLGHSAGFTWERCVDRTLALYTNLTQR